MVERRRSTREHERLYHCPDCGVMGPGPDLVHYRCDSPSPFRPILCKYCKKFIYAGEARYTGGEYKNEFAHYECRALDHARLDRELRAIKGPLAKVAKEFADALKRLKS